jgi:hypothetical protein
MKKAKRTPTHMTLVAYAQHRGVSKQRISALRKRGVLVMEGNSVVVHASDAILDRKPSGDGQETLFEAICRKERALANLRELELKRRELELKEKTGELVKLEEVRSGVASMILRARDILLRIGPELRDRLAQETDPIRCEALVMDEIYRALNQLAQPLPDRALEDDIVGPGGTGVAETARWERN